MKEVAEGGHSELVPCRVCQHRVSRDARVCPSCGAVVPWKSQTEVDEETRKLAEQAAKGQKFMLGCLLAVGGLIFLIVIISMMGGSGELSTAECERRRQVVAERLGRGTLADSHVAALSECAGR